MSAKKQQTTGRKRSLSPETVELITRIASEYAVKKYNEEKAAALEQLKDKRYRNTKLLVRKYRQLRDYQANAIYTTSQLLSDQTDEILTALGIDPEDKYEVGRIRDNVVVTKVIMDHVETMIEVYHQRCEKSKKPEDRRRWRVLNSMYFSDDAKNAQEVADIENVSVSMVYQDIDNACEELTPLFFGLDLMQFYE